MALVAGVRADGEGRGRLLVPGDHFQPGETMSILGTDLDPGADLVLRLTNGPAVAEIGRATVADDRTITTSATVPSTFPLGYAELSATDGAGFETSTQVLIGDRAEAPGGSPAGGSTLDERTIWLALLGVGVVIFAIAATSFLRARPRRSGDID